MSISRVAFSEMSRDRQLEEMNILLRREAYHLENNWYKMDEQVRAMTSFMINSLHRNIVKVKKGLNPDPFLDQII